MSDYDDIIDLPHHQSATRPHMSMTERAAQFSPFAALTGYEAVLEETARLTDRRIELSESEQAELDRTLAWLGDHLGEKPKAALTYFVPDEAKEGGSYRTVTGRIRQIDAVNRTVKIEDGGEIGISDLYALEILENAPGS